MRKISLNEKLVLSFLTIGIGTIIIITTYSFISTRKALMERTSDQLTSLRVVKTKQVEDFLADRLKDVNLASKSEGIATLAARLDELENIDTPSLTALLNLQAGNTLFNNLESMQYRGFSIVTRKGLTVDVVLNHRSPQVEISRDTMLNLRLKNLMLQMVLNPSALFSDYSLPAPGSANILLAASPLKSEDGRMTGIMVLEIPSGWIDRIMLDQTPDNGLGNSGETYLVGSDFLMRSQSRFIPASIMRTMVKTESARKAFRNTEGIMITNDYRDISVFSSYSRIRVPGLSWIILSEIDVKEAMVPIYSMRNNVLFMTAVISVIFFILVLFISKRITRPLNSLKEALIRLGDGKYDGALPVTTSDEIGDLTKSFNAMAGQIKEKSTALEQEKAMRLRSVIDGQETERQRLSRELHDGIGQSLIALKLKMENIDITRDKKQEEKMQDAKLFLNQTIDEVRRISNDLMPAVLQEFGLVTALKNLLRMAGEGSGIKISFSSAGENGHPDKQIQMYVYRIAQEGISNMIRHAHATEVSLHLQISEQAISMELEDNGIGFIPELVNTNKSHGLQNMKERTELLQGQFILRTERNKGTMIKIVIPQSTRYE